MPGGNVQIHPPASGAQSAPDVSCAPRSLGLLIPEFPTQTHIAMWRLGQGIARRGVRLEMLSTRRPGGEPVGHPELREAAKNTFYAWPASPLSLAGELARSLARLPRALAYVASLREGGPGEKLKVLAMILPALSLKRHARERRLDHLFAHSCAGAAHVLALCKRLGGPAHSLRLGGEPSVYGLNQRAKMGDAHLVVAAARVNKDQAIEIAGIPDSRIIWTWLGVETEKFASPPRREGPLRDPRVVTVARLNHAKGHRYAIEAIASLVERGYNPEYVMVGDGPAREDLETRVREAGLEEHVVFDGEAGQQHILDRLRWADLFLLPTSGPGEGSPMALVEAMSSGLPALASDVGGLRDMVAPGVEGQLLPPGDAGAIAEAIASYADDAPRRADAGRASANRARSSFDVAAVAERLDHLFFPGTAS